MNGAVSLVFASLMAMVLNRVDCSNSICGIKWKIMVISRRIPILLNYIIQRGIRLLPKKTYVEKCSCASLPLPAGKRRMCLVLFNTSFDTKISVRRTTTELVTGRVLSLPLEPKYSCISATDKYRMPTYIYARGL